MSLPKKVGINDGKVASAYGGSASDTLNYPFSYPKKNEV